MADAWQFVLDTISSAWSWLSNWQFHGVSFAAYLLGYAILLILMRFIFG